MNQGLILIAENLLSFSEARNLSIDEGLSKVKGSNNEPLPVNNYLKTPEELEADFCFLINSRRAFHEKEDSFDTYGIQIMRTDGYRNIPGFNEILSGPMEENY